MRNIDIDREIERISAFIKGYFSEAGFSKAVIGLSGGIDSAVSAALTAKALGPENVWGFMLPYKASDPNSLAHALELVTAIGIPHRVIPISTWTDSYFDDYEPGADQLRRGNWMARARMCVLFDQSAALRALVIGTSNRSELLVGYFTQYGDSACALEPIGHLYKTEVKAMAARLRIPTSIIAKAPSADLWSGQTDEAEMGISYKNLDEALFDLTERNIQTWSPALPYSQADFDRASQLMRRSAFKRINPPIPEPPC